MVLASWLSVRILISFFSLAFEKRRAEEGISVYRIVLCLPDEITKENLSVMNLLLGTFVIAFSMHVPTARICFMFKILTIYFKELYGLPISNCASNCTVP